MDTLAYLLQKKSKQMYSVGIEQAICLLMLSAVLLNVRGG